MRTILLLLLLSGFLTTHASSHLPSKIINPQSSILDSLPTISCPASVQISTGPFTCTANHTYTVTANDDLPGWTLAQTVGLPSGTDFPLGATLNVFVVTDVDGNSASCSFTVTVKDYIPPYIACPVGTTVSVSDSDDPDDCYLPNLPGQFAGVAWINAAAFDDGTLDNCGGFRLSIRRMPPFSNFVQTLNQINGHPPCNDPFLDFPSEYERAVSEQDSIKFYCSEVGTSQPVILTAYQLDPDGSISTYQNGTPVFNQCLMNVFVENLIAPVCTPPAQVVVSCEMFDPSLLAYGEPTVWDNCCIGNLVKTVNYSQFDTICSRGTITRIFRAFDCSGNSSSCSQRVIVNHEQNYFIKFPNDTLVTTCNSTGVYGRPEFFGQDCELMGVSYADEIFGIIWPDACFQIERNWTVINWCTFVPGLPLTNVPNPSLVSTQYHNPLNAPGPTVSACGTPLPWAPTISKIIPSDTVATNYCSFWNATANGFRYKQHIKIADSTPPTFVNCTPGVTTFLDPTENHPFYWNNIFNPTLPSQNLAERQIDLSIEATDTCYGGSINIRYLLFLDLDNDGIMESVVNSMNPPPADTIYYNNLQSPNFVGGTPVSFDNRPVAQNEKWRFAMQENTVGTSRIADLRWNTAAAPNTFVTPELPVGTHKIKWFAQDGCGSQRECEHVFSVVANPFECIPPADVLVPCEQFNPNLLNYGEPTFSGGCLFMDLDKSADYTQFDSICSKGTIVRNFNAVDDCGAVSQCSQQVVVNHQQNYYIQFPNDVIVTSDCNGTGIYGEPTFFGEDCELLGISYEDEEINPVPDACFRIYRNWTVINWCTYNPALPIIYVPNPNPNPITNHAANLPGPTVSACGAAPPWASTIVKINPTDPTATDFCTFWNASANGYSYKQTIKIWDSTPPTFSNCLALPSIWADSTQSDPELWNNVFDPALPAQDLRETPIELTVTVTDACSGSNINIEYLLFLDLNANGQQETVVNSTTLGIAGLGWNKVLYDNFNTPNFLGGTPTTFDDRPVPPDQKWGFAIQESVQGNNKTASVRWNTQQSPNTYVQPELPNGRHKIKWFSTDGCGNNKECEQIFSIGDTTLVGSHSPENEGFILFQNEPNPFRNSTVVRFQLPESTPATLSIFNAEGRLLFQQTADYIQGMNAVTLEKAGLPPGVLFYKLEAGANMAWRKMVLLR